MNITFMTYVVSYLGWWVESLYFISIFILALAELMPFDAKCGALAWWQSTTFGEKETLLKKLILSGFLRWLGTRSKLNPSSSFVFSKLDWSWRFWLEFCGGTQKSVFVTGTHVANLENIILVYIFKSEVYFSMQFDALVQPDLSWHDSPT